MIGKVADSFTAILCRDHTAVTITAQQLSTNETHNHSCTVSIGALELGTPKHVNIIKHMDHMIKYMDHMIKHITMP